jgi:hypothetical protein
MNLSQSSQILEFFGRFGQGWTNSRTRRVVDKILAFWDRCVRGSRSISWLTGTDFQKKVSAKESYFAGSIQSCWTNFLSWIEKTFVSSRSMSQSGMIGFIKKAIEYTGNNFLSSIGWIACGFLPAYGILRLQFGNTMIVILIGIIVCLVVSILLLFAKGSVRDLVSGSRLLKVLDDIDE